MISMDELNSLLGKSVHDVNVRDVLKPLRLKSTVDEDDLDEGGEPIRWLTTKKGGCQIRADSGGRIEVIFYFFTKVDGFTPFTGALAYGLTVNSNRDDVRRRLGEPSKSGEAYTDSILGRQGPWDRYDFEAQSFHIQYREPDDLIKQITGMVAEVTP